MTTNCVILCGGSGTRLWPLSREKLPKQLLSLVNARTMLQNTILRFHRSSISIHQYVFICNADHAFIIKQQMEELGIGDNYMIITEPKGRDTAPAIAISSLAADPDHLSIVVPSDHVFNDTEFAALIGEKVDTYTDSVVLFGVRPTHPSTAYGYIRSSGLADGYNAKEFVEKPDADTATQYIRMGAYYWNAGVFLFKNKVMLDCFRKYAPDILGQCESAFAKSVKANKIMSLPEAEFGLCTPLSIDYAIMENICKDDTRNVPIRVYPYSHEWCDVGSFESLHEYILNQNTKGGSQMFNNVKVGDVHTLDAADCYIHSEKGLVAAVGVSNLVIVNTPDAVLVCDKKNTQDIKRVVKHLQTSKRTEHVFHTKVFRPWGWYVNVDGGDHSGIKIKRLLVYPAKRLSLQSHDKREEHWVVARGKARVQVGDEVLTLSQNDYVHIPTKAVHRVENIGDEMLEIVETQIGTYLGEDDIVR